MKGTYIKLSNYMPPGRIIISQKFSNGRVLSPMSKDLASRRVVPRTFGFEDQQDLFTGASHKQMERYTIFLD